MHRRFQLILTIWSALFLLPHAASAFEIVDMAGRTITMERPASKVLLGEGRFLVAISLLEPKDPASRVAGLLNEFARFDPSGFGQYVKAFPEIQSLPTFGQTSEASVSLEKAIMLQPDAAVFGLSGHGPKAKSAKIIRTLENAGIPVVFIDFRNDPLGNTAKSMRILGRLLGKEAEAQRFAAFYEQEKARVTERLSGAAIKKPRVLMELHVGLRDQCCFSMAKGSLADLMATAGGVSIATEKLPGPVGMLSLEYVLSQEPDIFIGTAIGSRENSLGNGQIALGTGIDAVFARKTLANSLDRPGIEGLKAVKSDRAYALWHHFYNSPLNVYALQTMAKWFHPELFADMDPEATLGTMLDWIKPVDLGGTYAVDLLPGQERKAQ